MQLVIFIPQENEDKQNPVANREGFGHIAFSVSNVEAILEKMISCGGTKLGEVVKTDFAQGTLIFTYARDPEGNIIELQTWKSKT
jgi:catechol 2,3-dioxygenase-like lactoylglutathione lyase family enzyme